MNRVLRALVFALAVALGSVPGLADVCGKSYTTTVFVDFDGGNDSTGSGTRAAPYRSLQKVVDTLFTGVATDTPISVEIVVAGTSGGTNTGSRGWDQFTFDTTGRTARTEVGQRDWTAADGARPSSAAIARPVLRADNPFTSLTAVSGSVVYKSNALSGFSTSGTNAVTGVSQVLYKPGVTTQLDSEGAWKCHIKIVGSNTDSDTTIRDALIAAGPYTAWYKTSTKEIFVNLDSNADADIVDATDLSATASNWSWCASQTVENFSKFRPIGFTDVRVENCDFVWGERGPVVFDASEAARIKGVRAYEMQVHGIMASYSNTALQNIVFENCEVHGGGQSATGTTMMAAAGQSNNANMSDVRFVNCKLRRYMLQNPGGINYNRTLSGTWDNRQYPLYFVGIGTSAASSSGLVLPGGAVVEGCTFEDVSSAKTMTTRAGLGDYTRHTAPANTADFLSYPVQYVRCNIRTFGTWLTSSETSNQGNTAVAFNNCKILCKSPDATLYTWGVRTAVVFSPPVDAAAKNYVGVFGGTEWVVDIGTADPSNLFCGFGPSVNGTANTGLRSYFTARDSTISLVSKSPQQTPIFEQNSDTDVADKHFFIDVQRSTLSYVTPPGMSLTGGQLSYRDLPASGNTSRIFLWNKYVGFNQTNISQANTTWTNFVANIDPYAVLNPVQQYVGPNNAPTPSITPWIRSRF